MPLLAATNIRCLFGERIVLDGVSLSIEPGERVGLVGRNGTGKSTLMRILCGRLRPDAGDVNLLRGRSLGMLDQDPDLDPDETLRGAAESAFAELHDLHRTLEQVYESMGEAEGEDLERLLRRQADLERRIEAAGGYAVDHRVDAVLHGLGFSDAQFGIPVTGLSGGQRSRLALAILLLREPDILLLDEPTNHLDLDGRLWLERFLTEEFRGAVLMISHDRYLLDNVVTRIIEVEHERLIDYPGSYGVFRKLRAERREAQLRAWENQQSKFRQEERFIQKYKAGQRAKQARGRESRLRREKQQGIDRPVELDTLSLRFEPAKRSGDIVVSARGLAKRYTNDDGSVKTLFENLDVTIERGERWGIIGPNGAGKSTLVRCLLDEQTPDEGSVRLGSNVSVGYFRQEHVDVDPDLPVYRFIQRRILKEHPDGALSEQQARNLAGAFLFSGSEQDKPMDVLSGGERARAVLASLLASARNLLVLDEPTNHLDIPSAERLEDALRNDADARTGFPGTLVLISHDRALIDATCDHLIVLDGRGGAEVFLGNYTHWHRRGVERERAARREQDVQERRRRAQQRREKAGARRGPRKQRAGASPDALERLATGELEQRIEAIENRIAAIDRDLADPDVWRKPDRCTELGEERARLAGEIEPLEFEWARRAEQA